MESIMISVIIPVYNIKNYLEKCLLSVINQSYSNWEMILVDDGSTDGTEDICDKWKDIDHRITVVHKKNGGISSARNMGITLARGIYLFFLDGDDYIVNNMFENLSTELLLEPADCIIFNGKVINESTKKNLSSYEIAYKLDKIVTGNEILNILFRNKKFRPSACLYICKRCVIEKAGIKFHEGIIYEDELFTYILLLNCNSVKKVDNIFYVRRIRLDSVMTSHVSNKNFISIVTVYRETLKYIEIHLLDKKNYIISYRMKQLFYLINYLYKILDKNEKQVCKELYVEILSEISKEYKHKFLIVFIISICKVEISLLKNKIKKFMI